MVDVIRIAIAGNIGAGKSTVAHAATQHPYDTTLLYAIPSESHLKRIIASHQEEFDSALFDRYTAEPEKYALAFQLNILLASAQLEDRISTAGGIAIIDRSFYEHRHIFGEAQRIMERIDQQNFAVYDKIYRRLAKDVPHPDLFVRLQADVPTLQKNIKRRGRPQEQWLIEDSSYLTLLNQLYNRFFEENVTEPVIDIDIAKISSQEKEQLGKEQLDEQYLYNIFQKIAEKIPYLISL